MHNARKMALWGGLIVLAGAAGAWISWHFSTPLDPQRESRSFAILAAGILIGGVLIICATGRFWLVRRNPHHPHHHRSRNSDKQA